jgi:hypothetical protein
VPQDGAAGRRVGLDLEASHADLAARRSAELAARRQGECVAAWRKRHRARRCENEDVDDEPRPPGLAHHVAGIEGDERLLPDQVHGPLGGRPRRELLGGEARLSLRRDPLVGELCPHREHLVPVVIAGLEGKGGLSLGDGVVVSTARIGCGGAAADGGPGAADAGVRDGGSGGRSPGGGCAKGGGAPTTGWACLLLILATLAGIRRGPLTVRRGPGLGGPPRAGW